MSSQENALSSSLTDLMTSLMVIFILLLVNFLRIEQEGQKELKDNVAGLQQALNDLVGKLASEKKLEGVKVEKEPNDPLTLVVIVPDLSTGPGLFEFAKADPSPSLVSFLDAFGPLFIGLVASEQWNGEIRNVTIEGHTDHRQSKETPFFNLELSQDRSRKVLERLLKIAKDENIDVLDRFWGISSASGRADKECDATAEGPEEDQRRCRKVLFKVRVKSYLEKQLRDLAVPTKLGSTT